MHRFSAWLLVALLCTSCSDEPPEGKTEPPAVGRVASTRGGAVVLSRDERVAVTANRSAGAITVLRLDPTRDPSEMVSNDSRVEYDAGERSEPWAAVIGADDDTAYVVLRSLGAIQRIKNLHATPEFSGRLQVGAEPTAIAISPSGDYLFVANWGDGTLSTIPTASFDDPELNHFRVDFNRTLAATELLGSMGARPGLAHPRALAMTDNGDDVDGDETLYLTEFFSQPLEGVTDDSEHLSVDRNRQGLVYSFPVSGAGVMEAPIHRLAPVPDTGFPDSDSKATACFPNQLYAAAVEGPTLFVTAMCASPRGPGGPANALTVTHPAIFALDTATGSALPPVVLTNALRQAYDADATTTTDRRMPLIPNDLAVGRDPSRPGVRSAYVTAFGADAVFRVDFAEDGSFVNVGAPGARYMDLRQVGGLLPIGVALSKNSAHPFALILNDNSQNVAVVDRTTDAVVDSVPTTGKDPKTGNPTRANSVQRTPANSGRQRFATGLGVWSVDGQAVSSCESCHPDGLSDGVTWFFTRGPRRTLSTAATYDKGEPSRRRIMLWGANIDEVHDVEVIARTVSGGVGAIAWDYHPSTDCRLLYDGKGCATSSPAGTCVLTGSGSEECDAPKHTTTLLSGLNGALGTLFPNPPGACEADAETCDVSSVADWNFIDAFVQSVRTPRSPRIGSAPDLSTQEIVTGIQLFREGRCAACHGGRGWTISKLFYEPGPAANGALPYLPPATEIFELLGSLRTTTYEPEPGFPRELNPASLNGPATLRSWAPAGATDADAKTYAYDTGQANDQINCALRAVGTFPAQMPDQPNVIGVTAPGAPVVLELRQDMKTLAFGANGFNVPSLLGLATRAPYYHAGNARTLEEVFDPVFRAHYQAMAPGFLGEAPDRTAKVRALVHFLLSIDDTTAIEPIPSDLGYDPVLCPPPEN